LLENKHKKGSYVNVNKPYNNPRVDYTAKHNDSSEKSFETQKVNTPFIKSLNPGQPDPNFPIEKVCRYCRTPGHLINECQKLAYRQSL